jgi:hypothetical protein
MLRCAPRWQIFFDLKPTSWIPAKEDFHRQTPAFVKATARQALNDAKVEKR